MFVLNYKGRVISGPMDWNKAMFEGALEKEGIQTSLSFNDPGVSPFVVNEDAAIYKAELVYQNFDKRTEYLNGPFWTFEADKAVGTFEIVVNPVDVIKNYLKSEAVNVRRTKENSGFVTTVAGTEVFVITERGQRAVNAGNWKFTDGNKTVTVDDQEQQVQVPSAWVNLTEADAAQVNAEIYAHVQGAFDWEFAKGQEIDAATTVEQLKAIEL